jgi:4-amino-4-deoxy-L-arabinose transferase-like glycosyltransferase
MSTTHRTLLFICLAALVLRCAMLLFIHNPGMDDSLHYFNLGRRLVEGKGFTIDYVWHHLRRYDDLTHPIDYWMPLAGVIAAGSMSLFGVNTFAGLLPFLLMGSLIPLLVYAAARQYHMDEKTSLIAAAFALALPELVWQSTRLLTTTPNMLLVGGSILLLTYGLQTGRWWAFTLSGILAGLGYLNRNDVVLLIPMTIVLIGVYALWGRKYIRKQWGYLILMAVAAFLVILPWSLRNLRELGQMGMVENSRVFFMVEYNDHHSYDNDRITLERMLAELTPAQIISKRVFELFAATKQIINSLQPILIIGVVGGIALMLWRKDAAMWIASAPVLILLLGILIAYPILIPMKSQGGSFRMALGTLLPLLLPFAAYALTQAIERQAYQIGATVLIVGLSAFLSADMVRTQTAAIDQYHAFVQQIVALTETLPDVIGDGEIRLMTQDPIALSYYGVSSALVPNGTRDQIIEVAQRYQIDYVMLPTAWTDLDVFHGKAQSDDPRFVYTAAIERAGRLPAEFYAIVPDAEN